ncbi:MAG: rhomboid family intramembrane serine protease [Draconibacterium sp.]|nr:rhomboid family intramembrane serine protease [Draconibacterium sp.]
MKLEKKIFVHSLIFPAVFVFLFWVVEIIEQTTGLSFVKFGVYPLHLKGLPGILFAPFIHANFNHLISNSIPFFVLLFALIYFYRRISYRIFFQMYILAGLCVWLSGREAWHIGASGVIYALAAFHFVSGIIRNDIRLLTISVVVVFLYGGMVWGMLPINPDVSWESHLWGSISGIVLAIYYRRYILRRDKFDWEDEDDEEDEIDGKQWQLTGEEEVDSYQAQLAEKGKVDRDRSQLAGKKEEANRVQSPFKGRENVDSSETKIQKPNNVSHTGEF